MSEESLCPKCKKPHHPDAKVCAYCKAQLKTSFLVKLIAGFFGLVIFMTVCTRIVSPTDPNAVAAPQVERIPTEAENKLKAKQDCKWAVKDTLHDPSSADFDSTSSFFAEKNKLGYMVQVTGRAKNGFGALRKITVNCSISSYGKILSIKQIL